MYVTDLLQEKNLLRFPKHWYDSNISFQIPVMSDRRSYLLLPLYSEILLESTNVLDHIITFKGTHSFML